MPIPPIFQRNPELDGNQKNSKRNGENHSEDHFENHSEDHFEEFLGGNPFIPEEGRNYNH